LTTVQRRRDIALAMDGPRLLYLHGFASGPDSTKAVQLAEHYAARGVTLERLNLRLPSLEHLRLSTMIAAVRAAIGGEHDRAVLFGSSLGGLTAFRVVERWRDGMSDAEWRRWRELGYYETEDYATGRMARVDHGFIVDAEEVDARGGGWPDVRVPTLILHGCGDEVVPIELSRRFAAGQRHVRLIELDDGHQLAASLPAIASAADQFLAGVLG
jgi:pimeloyl-ACP methyl ester carboxylesterase